MSALKTLDSIAQNVLARPLLLKSLQTGTILSLGVMTGIATCLHSWVIPIVERSPTSRAKLAQFRTVIYMGFRHLQSLGKIYAVAMGALAFLCSRSGNANIAARTRPYVAAMVIAALVSPYEITTIFPTNDRMFEIDDQLKREGKDNFGDERDQEIDSLLKQWQWWHTGRIVLPLASAIILTMSSLS